jgi:hypothetical protein
MCDVGFEPHKGFFFKIKGSLFWQGFERSWPAFGVVSQVKTHLGAIGLKLLPVFIKQVRLGYFGISVFFRCFRY